MKLSTLKLKKKHKTPPVRVKAPPLKEDKRKPGLIVVSFPVRKGGRKVIFRGVRSDVPLHPKAVSYYKAKKKKNYPSYVPVGGLPDSVIRSVLGSYLRKEVDMTLAQEGGFDAYRLSTKKP